MTKELARNILTEHIRLMGDEPSLNEDKEALSMAIQALSQEPCTDAVANGTPIPDNATNGDVIKILFADFMYVPWKEWLMIDLPWWNAPYQKGGEV